MSNAEKYLQLYRQLENIIRDMYDLTANDPIRHYLKSPKQHRYKVKELDYCVNVRNFLSHSVGIGDDYPVQPTESMIEFITKLIKNLEERPKCIEFAVHLNYVYRQTMDDYVLNAMETMREQKYSCIPIVENNVVVGVFSENTIFNYVVDKKSVAIDSKLKFRDIKNYTHLDASDVETYCFYQADEYLDKLLELFEKEFEQARRLNMVFLTQKGRRTERLKGIITPWDILGQGL